MISTITPVLDSPVDGMKKLKVGHIYQLQYVRAFVHVCVCAWMGWGHRMHVQRANPMGTRCVYKSLIPIWKSCTITIVSVCTRD